MALAATIGAAGANLRAADALDSVVASIGRQAITASDVEQEYRFERFLDAQWPPPPATAATLASARQRLTYQLLLIREEDPGPAEKAESENSAARRWAALRKEFVPTGAFAQALKDLGMTEAEVVARIAQQELMLRLIDERLRPAAAPTDQAVSFYYHSTFVPEFRKQNHGAAPPPLATVDTQVREILVQKRINELLDQWIDDLKPTSGLRFHSF